MIGFLAQRRKWTIFAFTPVLMVDLLQVAESAVITSCFGTWICGARNLLDGLGGNCTFNVVLRVF
jgi:hypothetical protein